MPRQGVLTEAAARQAAEALAIEALAFLADDPDRLGDFLSLSGLSPDDVRGAASEPGFLAGVLDHLRGDERLLLAFAQAAGVRPERDRGGPHPPRRRRPGMALIALCRDCLARAAPAGGRCAHCGSPRLLIHPELDQLAIAHIDCDAFYAAIEKRDDPSLHDKPLIVGGGRRGVVATCCYIARESGVRSAMPMFKALALCPEAVVVRPRMARYAEVGRAIREAMLQLTPLVEPLSIDEAFLDLRGTERLHGASPAVALARFTREVEHAFGVTVSVGLSDCKLLAKIASEMDKPRGFKVIGRSEAQAVLAPLPVTAIWGVGRVAAERLRAAGLVKLADIQAIDLSEASRRPELDGGRLWRMARGLDDRPVRAERDHKGLSAETTFATDIADPEALSQALWTLCEKVSGRLKAQGVGARTVTVKLKTHDFKLRTPGESPARANPARRANLRRRPRPFAT